MLSLLQTSRGLGEKARGKTTTYCPYIRPQSQEGGRDRTTEKEGEKRPSRFVDISEEKRKKKGKRAVEERHTEKEASILFFFFSYRIN